MICEFVDMLGISFELVQSIFKECEHVTDWHEIHPPTPHSYCVLSVREFLAKSKITVVSHPPYSPDLFLYPKLKIALKGKRFNIIKIQWTARHMPSFNPCAP